MPFKSESQRRRFYAMASRGEISKATVKHWEDATPKGKKLPEHVKKQASILWSAFADELTKIADLTSIVLSQLARREAAPPVTKAIGDAEESVAEKWRRFSSQNLLD